MAYQKGHPSRMKLTQGNYDLLMDALKTNEDKFDGFISDNAKTLMEKIENHGRIETEENGDVFVRLGFYEKEAEHFIWQFIALAKIASDCSILKTENQTEEC